MIAYKVVEKRTRWCSNWTLFKGDSPSYNVKKVEIILRKRFKAFDKWFPRYHKGTVVEAVSGSLGIMTFINKSEAKHFKSSYSTLENNGMIIKVQGIGKPREVKRMVHGCCDPFLISRRKKDYQTSKINITSFSAVKVLE